MGLFSTISSGISSALGISTENKVDPALAARLSGDKLINLKKAVGDTTPASLTGVFTPKGNEIIRKHVNYQIEDLNSGAFRPPVEAKLPFVPVTIKTDNTQGGGGLFNSFTAGLIEWPERVAKTFYQVITKGEKLTPQEFGVHKVNTAIDEYKNNIQTNPYFQAHPFQAYALAAFSGALDMLPVGQFGESFVKTTLAKLGAADRVVMEAKIAMGFGPDDVVTPESLKKQFLQTANVVHPDKGGAAGAFQKLNTANETLTVALEKSGGVIKPLSQGDKVAQKVAETLNTKVGDLMKTPKGTPYLGVKGLLPRNAGMETTQPFQQFQTPKFGLSIEPVPEKPVAQGGLFDTMLPKIEPAPTVASQGVAGTALEGGVAQTPTMADISPEVEAKAQIDWQDNYAEDYANLSDKTTKLEKLLQTARASEKYPLQTQIKDLNKQMGAMEHEFVTKYAVPETKTPTITTPRDAAKDLIRVYVERGDTIQALRSGQMGTSGPDYSAGIGGYAGGKLIGSDRIKVDKFGGKELNPPQIFSLKELFDEIKIEKQKPTLPMADYASGKNLPSTGKNNLTPKDIKELKSLKKIKDNAASVAREVIDRKKSQFLMQEAKKHSTVEEFIKKTGAEGEINYRDLGEWASTAEKSKNVADFHDKIIKENLASVKTMSGRRDVKLTDAELEQVAKKTIENEFVKRSKMSFEEFFNHVKADRNGGVSKPELTTLYNQAITGKIDVPKDILTNSKTRAGYIKKYVHDAIDTGKAVVVSPDIPKEILNDNDPANALAWSKFSNEMLDYALQVVENPIVKATTGFPGSGKTEILVPGLAENFNGIVVDSAHAQYEGLLKRIAKVQDAGKTIEIEGLIANPEFARHFALLREQDIGRIVPLDYHVAKILEYVDTYTNVLTNHPEIKIAFKDTRNIYTIEEAQASEYLIKSEALDIFNNLGYTKDELYAKLEKITGHKLPPRTFQELSGGHGTMAQRNEAQKRGESQEPQSSSELSQNDGTDTSINQTQIGEASAIIEKADFLLSKSGISAKDYALAKKTRQTLLREAVLGEPGMLAQNKIDIAQEKRAEINNDVLEGIKNSPYFRKEGDIKDAMGSGVLMEKGGGEAIIPGKGKVDVKGRFVIVESKDIPKYRQLGYKEKVGVDSLAMEAGFDDVQGGEEYLRSQLEASRAMRTTDVRTVTEKELLKNKNFSSVSDQIQATEDALAEETVPAKRLLLEQGKRELDRILFNDRKYKIRAVQEYFELSDQQMKKINYRDLRTMGVNEYNDYFAKVQAEAFKESENTQAKNELLDLIKQKEFKKVENLQRALKLPSIDKMTTSELQQFFSALEPFRQGDEFLTTRKLETIDKTDFAGIKTIREGREKLGAKLGLNPEDMEIKVGSLDRWRYDTSLAEKNPFYNYVVQNVLEKLTNADGNILELEHQVDRLFKTARKGSGIGNTIIPQDEKIFNYLESTEKLKLAEDMTPDEIAAAEFIRGKLKEVYDYQVAQKVMAKSRFEDIYVPHIQRDFLEALKDGGLKEALGEMFHSQKIDEQKMTILDQKTGLVLPLEKWFRFKVFRSGEAQPTKNVAKAFIIYMKAFENKKALDSIIPEIMTSVDILTPQETTEKGIIKDESLKTFISEYLNTRKGRPVRLAIKPGDPIDVVLQGLKGFTTIIDLGLNIPLQLGSHGGIQTALYTLLGPKDYATGLARSFTKQGREVIAKYENFVERTPWSALADTTKGLPAKAHSLMFALFRDATVRGNRIQLLGSMTDAEWAAEKITDKRLAQLKLEAGRWLPQEKSSSILGSTTEGKLATQYKKWAIVILRTNLKNLSTIAKFAKQGKFKEAFTGREAREYLREATVLGFVSLIAYAIGYTTDKNKIKQMSFIDKIINKLIQDSSSMLTAMSAGTYVGGVRVLSFVQNLITATQSLIALDEYKTSGPGYKKGDLKGVNLLERALLPAAYRQLTTESPAPKTSSSGGSNSAGRTNPFKATSSGRKDPFKASSGGRTNPFK